MPTLLFWPNVDAGSDAISKLIRTWRDRTRGLLLNVEYIRNMEPEAYQQALADAACCLGNSSSFVRDAGFYGTPTVIIGDRQHGREHDIHCQELLCDDALHIHHAVAFWRDNQKRFEPSTLYGDGHVSERVHAAMKRIEPYSQKHLGYSCRCSA